MRHGSRTVHRRPCAPWTVGHAPLDGLHRHLAGGSIIRREHVPVELEHAPWLALLQPLPGARRENERPASLNRDRRVDGRARVERPPWLDHVAGGELEQPRAIGVELRCPSRPQEVQAIARLPGRDDGLSGGKLPGLHPPGKVVQQLLEQDLPIEMTGKVVDDPLEKRMAGLPLVLLLRLPLLDDDFLASFQGVVLVPLTHDLRVNRWRKLRLERRLQPLGGTGKDHGDPVRIRGADEPDHGIDGREVEARDIPELEQDA